MRLSFKLRYVGSIAALLLSSWSAPCVWADPVYSDEAVKAVYLLRFSTYVEWPEERDSGDPFIFAVSNAPGVARELRRILPGNAIHGHIAEVREVSRPQDIVGARVLYVGAGHSELLSTLTAANPSVLTVTDDQQGLDNGSVLNFVNVDKRVRFEISLTSAERVGLKVSADLLSVAIRVHGGRRQSETYCLPLLLLDAGDMQCNIQEAHRDASRAARERLQASKRSHPALHPLV